MRLLLVEDDAMIGEAVLQVLRAEHYAVDWVRDGAMADAALKSEQYDLVLLDLGLPKRDGLDVLRALRQRRATVPVLVATARDGVADRVPDSMPGPTTTCSNPMTSTSYWRAFAPCCAAARAGASRCLNTRASTPESGNARSHAARPAGVAVSA